MTILGPPSPARLRSLRRLAQERLAIPVRGDGSEFSVGDTYRGFLAEALVADYLGVGDNLDQLVGDDGGVDLMLPWGLTIDVKFNGWANNGRVPLYLIFNTLGAFVADIAVLTCRHGTEAVELVGWIDKHYFEEIHERRDFGYGSKVCVLAKRLLSPATLEDMAKC